MGDKAVHTYPSIIKFVHKCYKTKEMCHRAVQRCFSVLHSITDNYRTEEICNLAVSLYFPFIVYCPYKFITQEMCDEAVNDSLVAMKLIPIGLLQVKWFKNFLQLCIQMKIYYTFMTILVELYLIIMKWVLPW